MAQNDIINQYLASGGTQADVDAYLGAHPDADVNQMASDAAAWSAPQGDAFGGFAPNVDNAPGGRGSLGGALSSIGDQNYAKVFNDPNRRRAEQTAGEFAAMGYSPYGMEEKWSPTPDVKAEALTRQKEGQLRAIVNNEGALTPERKAQFEADWAKIHPAAPPASGGGSGGIGPTGQPFTWGGGGGAGGGGADYGGGANYGGGGAGSLLGGYELPDSAAASQAMRDLQMGGLKGLQGLMSADTEAQRAQMQKALYKTSKRGINTAADRARQTMLEGTFGRGVGSSSILVESRRAPAAGAQRCPGAGGPRRLHGGRRGAARQSRRPARAEHGWVQCGDERAAGRGQRGARQSRAHAAGEPVRAQPRLPGFRERAESRPGRVPVWAESRPAAKPAGPASQPVWPEPRLPGHAEPTQPRRGSGGAATRQSAGLRDLGPAAAIRGRGERRQSRAANVSAAERPGFRGRPEPGPAGPDPLLAGERPAIHGHAERRAAGNASVSAAERPGFLGYAERGAAGAGAIPPDENRRPSRAARTSCNGSNRCSSSCSASRRTRSWPRTGRRGPWSAPG